MPNPAEIRAAIKLQPIAILGTGTSGRGAKALAERMGVETTLFDEKEMEGVRTEFSVGDAYHHAAVVVSPGFKEDHPWLVSARAAKRPILAELDFAAIFLSKPVWAVTGTNGKTTTCDFLVHTLNSTGQSAVCVGNNGVSLCGWLSENLDSEPTTKIVVEISSFQASNLRYLPIGGLIWTNFSENHLDHHANIDAYFEAKMSLTQRLVQPLFVIGESVFKFAQEKNFPLPDFTLVVPNHAQSPFDALPEETPLSLPPFDENFRLCVAFGERAGIPRLVWYQTAQNFQLPKHRFTQIGVIGGVKFFNDAKSTTFASTIAALNRFEKPVLWIGGGKSKGGDINAFAKQIAPKIKAAYLIGETGALLASLLRREGVTANYAETLDVAVKTAFQESTRTDNIVFSPAFSSLDQFANFSQRGLFFEKFVLELQSRVPEHTKV
jgi:UDP-N-acetylmuramoylalanine--D-glutamate ligase